MKITRVGKWLAISVSVLAVLGAGGKAWHDAKGAKEEGPGKAGTSFGAVEASGNGMAIVGNIAPVASQGGTVVVGPNVVIKHLVERNEELTSEMSKLLAELTRLREDYGLVQARLESEERVKREDAERKARYVRVARAEAQKVAEELAGRTDFFGAARDMIGTVIDHSFDESKGILIVDLIAEWSDLNRKEALLRVELREVKPGSFKREKLSVRKGDENFVQGEKIKAVVDAVQMYNDSSSSLPWERGLSPARGRLP